MGKTQIVFNGSCYAVMWEGTLDDRQYHDRQEAKRLLEAMYKNPAARPHKPKAHAKELSND